MIYKYSACLQRLYKLHLANLFYERESLHWKIFSSSISSHPPSKRLEKALMNRRPEMENRTEKICARTPQGQSWMLSLFKCFLRKTFFILQIIMKTSHPSPKGNFFIKIHLSCNFSVRKYALAFFLMKQVHHLSHTWKKNSNKECFRLIIWLSYLSDVKWGCLLASLCALM